MIFATAIAFSIGELISLAALVVALMGGIFWAGGINKGQKALEENVRVIFSKMDERDEKFARRMDERDERLTRHLVALEGTLDSKIARRVQLNCPLGERNHIGGKKEAL